MRGSLLCAAIVCVAACGRLDFDALPDSRVTSDAAPDTPSRACPWAANPTIGPVVRHTELSIARTETDPLLVRGDPLTIYFARDVSNGPQFDMFVAHRPTVDLPFNAPQPVAELATVPLNEFAVQLDTTGHGYYVRSPNAGPQDIYELQKDAGGVLREVRALTELDTGGPEYDPFSSPDDKTIYFTAGSANGQDIFFATRASTSDPWSNVTPFAHNTNGPDGGATLTRDGLVIVWAAEADVLVSSDIYYATRSSTSDPWGPKQLLGPGTISGSEHDLEPGIREDGCELFFARSPSPTDGNWDIYSATLQ
ncbi:MAG TPA: hypothetical protein VMZ53_18830 [Kofleriaceae bacterium]|nr:hypothetical protein [Kofleriaceae bacterium]